MGKLIEIVGNSGSGKTTLANSLIKTGYFLPGLEQHVERPFQKLMAADPQRHALANQLDYFLLRAEQEQKIRRHHLPGVMDGGLEVDFFLFTQLFHKKGYLTAQEFDICERLYRRLRESLGQPDLIIWLDVPVSAALLRYKQRSRNLEIARQDDLQELQKYLTKWLGKCYGVPLVRLDGLLTMDELAAKAIDMIKEYEIITVT